MEKLTFEAETGRLLDLVVHSLYTNRDVFLRELVSNASDALDRLRFEALTRPELWPDGDRLEITVEVDVTAKTVTVRDNGIGMSRSEVIDQIGTIARSGTRTLLEQINARDQAQADLTLIGRFGVGFYSSFMVAERVVLTTRRADEGHGTRWESSGDVDYTIDDAGAIARGTAVTLYLRPVEPETGTEDYTDRWVLSRIVKHYADFIAYPIVYVGPEAGLHAVETPASAPVRVVLNSMQPLWLRREHEVAAEEYSRFFQQLTHDTSPPLMRVVAKAEGRWEYRTLLFVPSRAPHDLYYHACEYGLQLYSQRMLIVKDCRELLPRYLRFVKGVVDAGDLLLHVSRQALQQAHHLEHIRKWLCRKMLDHLTSLRNTDPEGFLAFWREFGRAFKEGVSEDYANKDRLLPLILFESSADPVKLTTLSEYIGRLKPGQKEIWYSAGEHRAILERAPQLEAVRARGFEVLFLTEPVDELLVRAVHTFEGLPLRSVAHGTVDLDREAEGDKADQAFEARERELTDLVAWLARHLETHVRAVRLTKRLSVSPACLIGDAQEFSPVIERLLAAGRSGGRTHRRILELNPYHPLITAVEARFRDDVADPLLPLAADLLLGFASVAEGTPLPDPVAFNADLLELLQRVLSTNPIEAPTVSASALPA
jgi:molecular chaperone HtpG